jgi:LuxR family transcriptional regulator, maltose regulon positive regulatory protein
MNPPSAETLLPTKLFVPLLEADIVERSRLLEALAATRSASLVLVSAPAGSGKTTLVASFVRQAGRAIGWLSLDAADDHPGIFLSYLIEAFDRLQPGVGERARAMLQASPPPEPDLVARALIADLATAGADGILVIDDYHAVADPSIHELLSLLVQWAPPSVTLVVITRSDPPLPLSRLRVRRRLIEIREVDLRFEAEEAGEFLARYSGRAVRPESVAALASRTEGWAAGLQLAGLALRSSEDPEQFLAEFQGTHAYIADYLADEVLATIPAELQSFAIRSSLLDRLSGPLCDAALEVTNSQHLLEELLRTNLFLTRLDAERRWFRYHQLFSDLLRQRASGIDERERLAVLSRAAAWCEHNEAPDDAIRYAVRAGEIERAADLVARHGVEALAAGAAFRALRWIQLLPADIVGASPDHAVIAAWAHTLTEDYSSASAVSSRALELLAHGARPYPHVDDALLHARLIRAGSDALESRSPADVMDELVEIRETAPSENLPLCASANLMIGNLCLLLGRYEQGLAANERALEAAGQMGSDLIHLAAVTGMAGITLAHGYPRRAIEIAEREIASRRSMHQILGVQLANIHAITAFAYLELGGQDEAAAALVRSQAALGHPGKLGSAWPPAERLGRTRHSAFHSSAPVVYLGLAAFLGVMLRRGERSALDACISSLEDAVALTPGYAADIIVDSFRIRLLFAAGDRVRMQRWPRPADAEGVRPFTFWSDILRLTCARLALGAGDATSARSEIEALVSEIGSRDPTLCLAEAHVLHALACAELRLSDEAARSVERALALTQPEGRMGPWLDAGAAAVPLLERIVARAQGSAVMITHAVALLAALRRGEQTLARADEGLLSEREIAVLRLLAAGHTNQQIGKALFLAVGTVKKHTHNIFAKLDVSNRTQAVQTAQLRGLITERPVSSAE